MKEKKKSDLAVLLGYAGSCKRLTFLGLGLSAVAMVLGTLPYVCIWLAARDLIAVAPEWAKATELAKYGCLRRDCRLFWGIDVHPSGGLPHRLQHPQAGHGPSDEGALGLL